MTSHPRHRPRSDHFDGERFFNPGVSTDKSFGDIMRWRRTSIRTPWPEHVDNRPFPPPPARIEAGTVAVTMIGHATTLIRTATVTLLTDPVFSERASPFRFAGPRRVRSPGLTIDQLPPIDAVLLSHNHYDHMDLTSLRALQARFRAPIVTGLGNGAYLRRHGIEGAVECDWWEQHSIPGARITYVPAQHWSSRTMLDRRRMLWGGHVVETATGCIYFCGDSGYFNGFRHIRERFGSPDVALLPIGAYEPRWFMKTQHMNPDEAVQAHIDLGANRSVALHWGTFQLTDEGIDEPVRALDAAKRAHGLEPDAFLAPLPGETALWRRAEALSSASG